MKNPEIIGKENPIESEKRTIMVNGKAFCRTVVSNSGIERAFPMARAIIYIGDKAINVIIS